jgi:hypothetical protein
MRIKPKESGVWELSVGSLALILSLQQLIEDQFVFAALTLLLLAYLLYEVIQIRQTYPQRWLLHPVVICAVMFFFLGYCGTNVLFFLPSSAIDYLGLVPGVSPAMLTHQYLVLLGALALFVGYRSPLAAHFTHPHKVERFKNRFFPRTDVLSGWAIPIIMAIGFGGRVLAITLGIYGYGGDYSSERLLETSAYSQYLSLAGSLGSLALLLAALCYFAVGSQRRAAFWFWTSLFIEIFFGFLSGMKSAVGMPLVISGCALYLQRGIIPKRWIVLTIGSIIVAYAVIEPFRNARQERGATLTSVTSIVNVILEGSKRKSSPTSEEYSLITAVASRMNLSYIGSFGIDYADLHDQLPPSSPAFLANIFLAPLHAVVPRFIWDTKPLETLGLWYTKEIMGHDNFSATAMGPFTYLYFAGGYVAVGIAFFIIGVFQRMLFFYFSPSDSLAGAVVYLAMLYPLAVIDSSVNGIIINIVRNVPLLLILMQLIFRRNITKTQF